MAKETEIRKYVRRQIAFLAKDEEILERGGSKAQLAKLRRGAGKKPGELPELWGMFLKDMPEELLGRNGNPSYAEWAIYTALTLFALHQQGHSEPVNREGGENRFGRAVRKLVQNEENEENIRRKLSIVAGADDMEELSYHLRAVVKLLGNSEVKLDYADLAEDLYWFQHENQTDRVRLKWGQDFYRSFKTDDGRKEEKDEE
ncbi:MAG: type I-E CRISPR-associated protein Cse2/CasB [Lachnospiraceae bacterium]|nr:type I-E CRISPR-associated protein Cse2/CasB [Lachnospiraceae bacterium]